MAFPDSHSFAAAFLVSEIIFWTCTDFSFTVFGGNPLDYIDRMREFERKKLGEERRPHAEGAREGPK